MDFIDRESDDLLRSFCSVLIKDKLFNYIRCILINSKRFFDVCRDILFKEFSEGCDVFVKISDKMVTDINEKDFEKFKPLSGNIIKLSNLCALFDGMFSQMVNEDHIFFGIHIITPDHVMLPVVMGIKLIIYDNIKKIIVYDNSDMILNLIRVSDEDNAFSVDKLDLEQVPEDIYTKNPSDHKVLREGKFTPIIPFIERCYIIMMMEKPAYDYIRVPLGVT